MISIIICSIDPAKFSAVSRNFAAILGDEPHEIIGIHDAKSLCEGYNRAAAHARGDIIVFCHDDIEIISPNFRERLEHHLKTYDLIGVAGTDRVVGGMWSFAGPPYLFGQIAQWRQKLNVYDVSIFSTPMPSIGRIQALDGVFLAARRSVVGKIRFDQDTFDGWHLYDMDFTFAAHLAGFKLGVCCDIQIIHASDGNPDKVWEQYVRKFHRKYLRQLYPMPRRNFVVASVRVQTKQEVIEVMTPPFWGDLEIH